MSRIVRIKNALISPPALALAVFLAMIFWAWLHPIVPTVDTRGWTEYTDTDGRFQFWYPPKWVLNTSKTQLENGADATFLHVTSPDLTRIVNDSGYPGFSILIADAFEPFSYPPIERVPLIEHVPVNGPIEIRAQARGNETVVLLAVNRVKQYPTKAFILSSFFGMQVVLPGGNIPYNDDELKSFYGIVNSFRLLPGKP
jgi:hypothetical protein